MLRPNLQFGIGVAFEQVKNNIFDLLVNLACSFGDDQLDTLFKRLERSQVHNSLCEESRPASPLCAHTHMFHWSVQGRSSADTLKFLQLVKKLADSDAEGAMAYRCEPPTSRLSYKPTARQQSRNSRCDYTEVCLEDC